MEFVAFDGLKVSLDYPLSSVIAGENASGKSTLLFAAACAYRPPGAKVKDYVPSTLFPDYRPRVGMRRDTEREIEIAYDYSTPAGSMSMRWGRSSGGNRWNRSFFGRQKAAQPERPLYLRTLSTLSNPSEIRSVLQLSQKNELLSEEPMNAMQIDFAQRILPFDYLEVINFSLNRKNLLFASHRDGTDHCRVSIVGLAGERALLHLARGIAQLRGALVLTLMRSKQGFTHWVQRLY